MDILMVERESPAGFLDRPLPLLLVFGSFFLLTLPLASLAIFFPGVLKEVPLDLAFFLLLGNTHFCLTLVLYLQTSNLRYFDSSPLNRAIYFAVPAAIIGFFALCRGFRLTASHPAFALILSYFVRGFNFYHWGRQSFGMLQIFHQRGSRSPWGRVLESTFFDLLSVLMIASLLSGGVAPIQSPYFLAGLAAASFLFLACLAFGGTSPVTRTYLSLQALSGLLPIFNSSLYLISLYMHFMEYHVIMYPRVFHSPLGEGRADKILGVIRRNKVVFYLLLVNVSVVASLMVKSAALDLSTGRAMLLSLFDGLFLIHFFLESFVWRLGNPYYGKTVLPLLRPGVSRG